MLARTKIDIKDPHSEQLCLVKSFNMVYDTNLQKCFPRSQVWLRKQPMVAQIRPLWKMTGTIKAVAICVLWMFLFNDPPEI